MIGIQDLNHVKVRRTDGYGGQQTDPLFSLAMALFFWKTQNPEVLETT